MDTFYIVWFIIKNKIFTRVLLNIRYWRETTLESLCSRDWVTNKNGRRFG